MSGGNVPAPPAKNMSLDTSSITSSSPSPSPTVWDRLSTWASENKAIVYTIAGVAVVVTGAGVVYYLSDSRKQDKDTPGVEEKRKSKKERRKEKKKAEEEKKAELTKPEESTGMSQGVNQDCNANSSFL
jgi:mitochondrial import receptor subunit TOM70